MDINIKLADKIADGMRSILLVSINSTMTGIPINRLATKNSNDNLKAYSP